MQNLRIVKNQNDNANSLTLGWEYKCGQCSQCDTEEVNMITFKIYWEHNLPVGGGLNKCQAARPTMGLTPRISKWFLAHLARGLAAALALSKFGSNLKGCETDHSETIHL